MKRMFSICFSPDPGGAQNGGAQSAAPAGAPQSVDSASAASSASDSQPSATGSQSGAPPQKSVKSLADDLLRGEKLASDDLDRVLSAYSGNDDPAAAESPDRTTADATPADADPKPAAGDGTDSGLTDPTDSPNKMSESDAKTLKDAMSLVGAKDIGQLPEKINDLLKTVRGEGGKLGRQVQELDRTLRSQMTLISDVLDGKPDAMATAAKLLGRDPSVPAKPQVPASGRAAQPSGASAAAASTGLLDQMFLSDQQVADSMDPELVGRLNTQMKGMAQMFQEQLAQVRQQIEPVQQQLADATSRAVRERADLQVSAELANMATKYPDRYGVQSGDVSALLQEYRRGGPADPRIQPLLDLARYMLDNNLPNLETAHKVMYFDSASDHTQAVLKAKKETAQKILDRTPPKGAAGSAQGGQKTFNESELLAFANGSKTIPSEWMGPNGLDPSRMPADVREYFGF